MDGLFCILIFFYIGQKKLFNDDPKCNADFGFVADVSASVENHWDDEKNFMAQLVKSIVLSPQGGRVSVATFSNQAELMIKFSDHQTSSSFEAALDALPYLGSTTKINLGLMVALEEMFQVSNGMRLDALRNLFLITDGQQTGVDFTLWREKFNCAGIRVIVIVIGNVIPRDLIHLVNDDADLYVAEDFDVLLSDSFVKSIPLCAGMIIY